MKCAINSGHLLAIYLAAFFWVSHTSAQEPKLMLPLGHTAEVERVQFSPDGKRIVTVSIDNTAKIWDAISGLLLADLRGHTSLVCSAQFSPNGKMIVTASLDKTAKIWNAETGLLFKTLIGHTQSVLFAKFSPDGKKIITASTDSSAKVWDAENGLLLKTLTGHRWNVSYAEFSADNKKFLTASWDSTVRVWDAKSYGLLKILKGHSERVEFANFSPDGEKIVTASWDNTGRIWGTENGNLLGVLNGHYSEVHSAEFSPDGKQVLTSSEDHTARIWDAETGALIFNLQGRMGDGFPGYQTRNIADYGHSADVTSAQFSPDGKKVVTASRDETAKTWDAKTGQLLKTFIGHSGQIEFAEFSPDGKKIATASDDNTAKVWDPDTGTLLLDLKGHTSSVNSVQFASNDNVIITAYNDHEIRAWGTKDGTLQKVPKNYSSFAGSNLFSPDKKRIIIPGAFGSSDDVNKAIIKTMIDDKHEKELKLTGHTNLVTSGQFSPDGNLVVTASEDGTAKIWNPNTGKLVADLKGHTNTVNFAQFSFDGRKIVTASNDRTAKVWDAISGQLLKTLNGHQSEVLFAQFSADNELIATSSFDNTCKLWNTKTGKLLYTFFAVDSADSFNQTPAGYYKCTPGAARLLHYVTDSLEVITFEQLDIKYNRPDKVLSAIGYKDTALISAYHQAYLKRIERLKIDTATFSDDYSVPNAALVNRDQLKQHGGQLTLRISASDKIHTLDRFNVWVNQVPVYGVNGISLKKLQIKTLDTTAIITLSSDTNRIEVSVINSNGAESYHKPVVYTNTNAVKDTAKVYFLGIGIDHFADGQHSLQYSVNDIRGLALKFKSKFGDRCTIDTLFNDSVTKSQVEHLKQRLQHTSVNDKVILAYSGHGLLSKKYDYYLSSYFVDFDKPQVEGIPYETLENLLDSIPARRKLLLLDACNSGEIDKKAATEIAAQPDDMDMDQLNANAQRKSDEQEKNGGVSNQRFFELMQQLFVNVGKNTGSTIISSAAGTQFARTGDGNAVFTASILKFLEKQHCSISSLKQYVNVRVTALTNGRQIPTARTETNASDWNLW